MGRAPLRGLAKGHGQKVTHMLTEVNPQDRAAVLRLQEFLSGRGPWFRSLWGIGVLLAIDELHEACAMLRQGHLSEPSVKRMAGSLHKRVGQDPAFSDVEKQFLNQQIQQIPRAEGVTHYGLRHLSSHISTDYLKRWGAVVANGQYSVERYARSVSTFLLDEGLSGEYLHELIGKLIRSADKVSIGDVCEELNVALKNNPARDFEVLLALNSVPNLTKSTSAEWLNGASVTAWLKTEGFDTRGVRSPVAMVLKVRARDVYGAAHLAREVSDRYEARAQIATGKTLNRFPMLWVKGASEPLPLEGVSRGVNVGELIREDRIFSSDASQSVDAALELLSHLNSSSAPAAIAGGWAAIEGLLADPNDRSAAADNLAALVACSLPRAELTALSHRAERDSPDKFSMLKDLKTNRERSRAIASMILEGKMPTMKAVADQCAVSRVQKILKDPKAELQAIRDFASESFHRLYRQRNIILHGGRLDSVALTASLRTVAKLAGAGMDRITHGHYVKNIKPLELVARANFSLALLDKKSELEVIDLLE